MKYRVIYNGKNFKIQEKRFLRRWQNLKEWVKPTYTYTLGEYWTINYDSLERAELRIQELIDEERKRRERNKWRVVSPTYKV